MSSQSSGVPLVEKGEVHTESIQTPQPIDLAHHGPTVVQLRPVRTFGQIPHGTMKPSAGQATVGGLTAVAGTPTSIISVNRTGTGPNLTILPARGAGTPGGAPTQIPAYLARGIVGNVRSSLSTPGSITVTPISSAKLPSFGANIRLATPVNNGTWIQSSSTGQGQYTPLRAATITVSNRPVRPDGKMIHIPPGGHVQQVTQLQMVDNKGSILKPQITTTPIMNMRGTIHPQGSGGAGTPITLAPITIRTTNLANINTIQQRPPSANSNAASHFDLSRVQKVITQPPHGPPLQILNAQKIQTLPLPRLSTVCLTISTHGKGTIAPNNTAPVVTMASRQGGTSLVMTPSIGAQVSAGNTLPITKVYPVSRDVTPVVETFFPSPQVSSNASTAAVTVNAIPLTAQSGSGSQNNVVIASSSPSNSHHLVSTHGASNSHPHGHHVVQVHGPISVNSSGAAVGVGMSQSSVPPGTTTPSFYHVDPKNLNMNLLQQQHSYPRPIAIEKRTVSVTTGDTKSIMTGSAVILTTQNQAPNQHHTQSVTFPLAAAHSAFPHIPMSHQTSQILQTHPVLTSVSNVSCVGNSVTQNVQIGHHAIPTHVISQPSAVTTSSSANISSTVANSSTSSVIVTTSVVQPNSSVSVSTASSAPCSALTTVVSSNSLQTSTPAQSPSQTKSTLSPRPSILRKREAGDHNHHAVPSRAQRNLALNFSVNNPNVQVASASAAAAAAAAANKENSVVVSSVSLPPTVSSSQPLTSAALASSGVSILKKEFQPPNEESSWQSCSSNSSSGSTTISTTSETAEIQMQQQQQQQSQLPNNSPHGSHLLPTVTVGLPDLSVPMGKYGNMSNMGGNTGPPVSQNGIVRSVSGTSASSRPKSTNKTNLKDLERAKGRLDKDDGVSPRKKPRKQQLTTSDLFDSASPEISFYQGKRFKKSELMDPKMFEEFNDRVNDETAFEEAPVPRIAYYLKKPQMSLLQSNKYSSKPPQNHFQRYCDVKSKDERRPTVNDLLNQKNVIQKCNGWKLQHLNSQVEEIIEFEGDVVDRFTVLLNKLEAKVGPNSTDRDLNRIQELLKGNIQRGKVIRDQMLESKSQVLKILEHKPRVLDVINKYNSKRPIKKRERL